MGEQERDRDLGNTVGVTLVVLGFGSLVLPLFDLQFSLLFLLDAFGPAGPLISAGMVAAGLYILWSERG